MAFCTQMLSYNAAALCTAKAFPNPYDRRALLQFVSDIKSGVPVVRAPKYSHLYYDILPDEQIEVHDP